MTADRILLAHFGVTAFLCGLIWVVQLVHYPSFDRVDREGFVAFEAAHQQRISWIVAPAMLLEALTAGMWMLAAWRESDLVAWAVANAVLIAVVWASTALLSVPQHTVLSQGFDAEAHRRLVDTNWVRTIVWSVRTVALGWILARALGGRGA